MTSTNKPLTATGFTNMPFIGEGEQYFHAAAKFQPQAATSTRNQGSFQAATVRVTVTAASQMVRASFDPSAAERDRKMRALNQTARTGYVVPKASTK